MICDAEKPLCSHITYTTFLVEKIKYLFLFLVSLGWRLSNETFFEPLKNTISDFKLRGSVGTAGYDGTAAYQWLSGFNYNFFWIPGDAAVPTIDNTALANVDLTWETNTTYDIGFDAALFKNELTVSLDYFFRKREDVIARASSSIPSTLGVAVADQNLYEFSNQGFEFSLNYKKQINDKPAINYSLNLGAEYKNFSLSVLLTGAAGYDIYLDGEAQSPLRNGFNGYSYQLDYWTPQNTGATFPRVSDGGFNDNNYKYSDFWLRNGKHLRFKNINLSYTLPKFKNNAGFEKMMVFVTGYNLFVIKDYKEEFDPQNTSSVG